MKNTGFLLATSAVLAIVAAPAAAQTAQPTNGATDAVSETAKSESQKAAERADVRLNTGDRAESADPAWEHLKVCDTDSGKLNR